jgi:hypothetical protein
MMGELARLDDDVGSHIAATTRLGIFGLGWILMKAVSSIATKKL